MLDKNLSVSQYNIYFIDFPSEILIVDPTLATNENFSLLKFYIIIYKWILFFYLLMIKVLEII